MPQFHSRWLPSRRSLVPVALATALSPILFSTPVLANNQDAARYLDVQAQAQLEVAPDEATLNARLWELTPAIAQEDDSGDSGQALSDARQRLEKRAAALVTALEKAGLKRDAIRAGSLQVNQEVIQRPQRGGDTPAEPMVRTRLERPVTLSISDLSSLPVILDALTEAGVNSLDGVGYSLADSDAAKDEALGKALARARQKAELMAQSLNVELGDVISVSEAPMPGFQPKMMAMRAEAGGASSPAEYRPGTITIDAGVNVRWEIDQK
ncbi:SIMPL domain-containing protein [Halomonas binhaiensis]|uniref:SIMPL domain-containing protein n=1 Tax=Halomonas binhaiensis TaxID=2562282 RepID=A0A5C1NF32_9GAMM|nr:SIMPL domain-containing protein [Halomonas binhaiensis]QEM81038.1 SIMPL domain-containing protein [Halomonas binhaiensis]